MNFIRLVFYKATLVFNLVLNFYHSLNLSDTTLLFIKIWLWGGVAAILIYVLTFVIAIFLELIGIVRKPISKKQLLMSDALMQITPHSVPFIKHDRAFFNLFPLMALSWLTVLYIFILLITRRYMTSSFLKKDVKIWRKINTFINSILVFIILTLVVLMFVI